MRSLSQPASFERDIEFQASLSERWGKAFADLEIIENISKGDKDDREWLMECAKALSVLEEIEKIVKEQRRSVLESIRYEFPLDARFVREGELSAMTDDELLVDDARIFGEHGLPFALPVDDDDNLQDDYFSDFF